LREVVPRLRRLAIIANVCPDAVLEMGAVRLCRVTRINVFRDLKLVFVPYRGLRRLVRNTLLSKLSFRYIVLCGPVILAPALALFLHLSLL
jgi:hypothetical protein